MAERRVDESDTGCRTPRGQISEREEMERLGNRASIKGGVWLPPPTPPPLVTSTFAPGLGSPSPLVTLLVREKM